MTESEPMPIEDVFSILMNFIPKKKFREILERQFEVANIEDEFYKNIDDCPQIDPQVRDKLGIVKNCYVFGEYRAAIVFMGAAIEEELDVLYMQIEGEKPPKDFGVGKLIQWGKKNPERNPLIINDEDKWIFSLMYARNYFAHSIYSPIISDTIQFLETGKLDGVLPEQIEPPIYAEMFNYFFQKNTGSKIDWTRPNLNWLDSRECTFKALKLVLPFIYNMAVEYPFDIKERMKIYNEDNNNV